MRRQVFISHASADAELAIRICTGLEARGVPCWIAPRDVGFDGSTYGPEIARGLRECPVFLIVVTSAAAASTHVEREAAIATESDKRIIPVIAGRSSAGALEYYLAGRQRFFCPAKPDDEFLARLAAAIQQEPAHPAAAAPPPAYPRAGPGRLWKHIAIAAACIVAAFVSASYFKRPASRSQQDTAASPTSSKPPGPSGEEATRSGDKGTTPPDHTVPASPPTRVKQPRPSSSIPPSSAPKEDVASAKATTRPAAPAAPATPHPGSSAPATSAAAAVVEGVRLPFVTVRGGVYRMGCSPGDEDCRDDERPVRSVSIESFELSKTEVSQAFWEAVMGSNPSDFKGPALPVERVSWQDAQALVERLNARMDGFRYRLPTEGEWEYAARAGSATGPDNLAAAAWFGLALSSGAPSRPQQVATKAANAWGVHDMLGNVAEWCEDWYSPNYQRVVRGGSWKDGPAALRISSRAGAVPTTRVYSIGVRLVRERSQ